MPLHTYIINLRRRPDRRRYMQSILQPGMDCEFTTSWQGPLDGKDLTPDSLQGYGLFPWKIAADNRWWCRSLRKGEIGCSISHWLCWKNAQSTNRNVVLILEDDVYLVGDCMARLEAGVQRLYEYDPRWDLLYLGRVPLGPDKAACEGIVKPGYSYCTFAYLLTRSGIDALLQTSFDQAIIPVDEFLSAMYVDHPRGDVKARYPKRISAYAFAPPIAYQLPKRVAGSDTENSDSMV